MSKFIAGLLIGVATLAGTYAVATPIATPTSHGGANSEKKYTMAEARADYIDNIHQSVDAAVVTPKHTRGLDVALYQAHLHMRQEQWGCLESGSTDFGFQPRKRSPHIAMQ